jgi:hypothetical protein
MMKKFSLILSLAMVILSFACIASAVPHSWTETIDWDPDQLLNRNNEWFHYQHDLGNDGFDAAVDVVESYTLNIRLYDDNDDRGERAFIWQPGLPVIGDPDTVTRYDFTLEDAEIGWTLIGLADINYDGTLHLAIQRTRGDFYVDWSRITASGEKWDDGPSGSAPVPEPATMLLLGTGLAGMAAARRRKNK